MNSTLRTLLLWMVIFVVVILLWNTFQAGRTARNELTYNEFTEQVEAGQVAKKVTMREQTITGDLPAGRRVRQGRRVHRSSCPSGPTPTSSTS